MDANTIMIMGMFITIIIGLAAILKFQFQLNDKIQKMETELKDEITELKIRIERIESKLEINNKDYVYTNKRIDDTNEKINYANNKIDKIDEYNKNLIGKVLDVVNANTQKIGHTALSN